MQQTQHREDIQPGPQQIHTLFEQGDLVPVYKTMLADLETPVSVYLKLTQLGVTAFLLESVEGGEQVGRYSFLGVNPRKVLTFQGGDVSDGETTTPLPAGRDPLHVIRDELARFSAVKVEGLPRFVGGAVGFIGYDVVRFFEQLPESAPGDLDVPDAVMMFPDTLVIFDHAQHRLIILANAHNTGDPQAAYADAVHRIDSIAAVLAKPMPQPPQATAPLDEPVESNITQERFEAIVGQAREYIAAGDAFQIVLSQRFTRRTSTDPLTLYRSLRALNPSPYMFLLRFTDDLSLIGASPETMVRLEDGVAMVRPIAGTRPRGTTEAQDQALAEELLADPKERAEHVMLVDLGRNDLGRVCEYGSVKVDQMMVIERYSHVMHIVSEVTGTIRPDLDAFDLFRATFPAGTLSGAPKIRAMQIIEELEPTRRGPYGGAVGYFSYDGSMDTCITIRAVLQQGDRLYIQSGAGIVADSDPTREFQETVNKARALDVAVRRAEQGL
ncbi:MAG: anthranilate synthase component I [Chloroflexi bacterium]|nr:anthranilate synthase component I [Chloroflexota bacterium]